ncbi:TonB-dependent receptor [Pseudoxanthomonas helianthi]|uniref:TonB-dependent receptor n=1 Tax=Pseudoxanthomonas helianthi TaxID=1453541 RepID=A0A941ASM5_9GAMM|nr:TonB-dependent receptor [Pseudoxanthomonas helianthi]MBP3983699.1 TonB-dependent receptor [Pseudoxanthomonas helianthi]
MKYRKSLLSVAVATGLVVSMHAQAQDAAAPQQQAQATELDAVTVTGIRGSIEKALDVKRDAKSHVEVVTAEDIGKLPAKNVADTLRELPGVNISSSSASEGGFDEADRVSMRGTSPGLTQTLVNGHNIGTGDWFVLSQVQTVGRSVSYSLLPSEIVDQVVVHKGSEAKLVEGGSAGSVDIITRRPLQYADNFTATGSLGAVYSDLAGKTDPQVSALFNWKNDAGTIGVMVQGFSEERHLRRDGQEVVGGYGQIAADSAAALANPQLAGTYYPNLLGAVLFEQERKRTGGVLDIEVKAGDNLTLNLNAFASELKADNYNRNYMLWTSHALGNGATFANAVVQNGVITSGTLNPDGTAADGAYGVYDMISRPGAKSSSNYIALDADWRASDSLDLKFQLGTSKGKGSSPTQDVLETGIGQGAGASWAMHGIDKAIDWSLGGNNTPANHLPTAGWIFGGQGIDVSDKEDWFAADGEYGFTDGVLASLDFGVRYSEHERKNDFEIAQGPNWATDWQNIANYPTDAAHYPGDFGNGIGGSVPSEIWYYTPEQLAAINAEFANRNNPERFYFSDVYGVKEKVSAAYVQANFEGERWSGNVGLRYVKTDGTIRYNQALPVASGVPGAITGSAFGDYLPVTVDNSYNKLLPSVNLKLDLDDNVVARIAASKTMTRPDYSALAGSLSLDDLTHTGSGGNPQLDPLISTNFDVALEWYYAPRALLSASLYSMHLKDYVGFGTTTIAYKDQAASHETGTDVYSDYLVSVPVNTDGKVTGLELNWQQPIGEWFGVSANYTRANSSTEGGKPLNGTSRNTYNVAGYFENDTFSARVAYSFREAFYAGVSRTDAFYEDDFGTVSASLNYKATDWLTISLDGLNLNDPVKSYYTKTAAGVLPYAMYSNGRQYYLNFRFKF